MVAVVTHLQLMKEKSHPGLIVSEEEPEVEGQEEGLTTELWDKYRFGFFTVLINVYLIWV